MAGAAVAGLWSSAQAASEPIIEEITVTAQKRQELAQDVPISLKAFSADMLQDLSAHEVSDLPRILSSFSIIRGVQSAGLGLRIRGIGALGNTAIEPSVATFLDGIYIPRPGAVFGSFMDIESIEILRGPQGTLFGRNASIGALTVRSARPTQQQEGRLKFDIGNGGLYRLDGMENIPLSDKVSVRVAAQGQIFDGYWKNTFQNRRFGGTDQYQGRVSILSNLSDTVSWLLKADYSHLKGTRSPLTELDPSTVTPAGLANLAAFTGGQLPDLQLYDNKARFYIAPGNFEKDRQWGVMSELNIDMASGYSVRMLNSFRHYVNDSQDGDLTFVPVRLLARPNYFKSDSQTHELQLFTPKDELLGGRFDAVAGVYFFGEQYGVGEKFTLLEDYCPLLISRIAPANLAACVAGPPQATQLTFKQRLNSLATYGQGNFKVLDNLRVSLGGRWTEEWKRGSFNQLVFNNAATILRTPENTPLSLTQDKFTWRGNISWYPVDHVHAFASYSTGYKSGGFNSTGSNIVLGQLRLFGPENVDNYEAGVKTEWLDRRLILNATLYRTIINGLQDRTASADNAAVFFVRNSGKLRVQGVEFEGQAAPAEWVKLNSSVAYLNSKFLSFPNASQLPGLPGSQNLTGGYNHFSPTWSGTVGVEFLGGIADSGMTWRLRNDLTFQSKANVGGGALDNNPQTIQAGYSLWSARFTLTSADERWDFSIYGTNLLDKGYSITSFTQLFDGPMGLRQGGGRSGIDITRGDPRTFGASVAFRW